MMLTLSGRIKDEYIDNILLMNGRIDDGGHTSSSSSPNVHF